MTNLSVITGGKVNTDLSLPAGMPIKDWIDDAVDDLAELHKGSAIGFDFKQETAWTIAPVAGVPVPRGKSLDEAQIVDGALVKLVPVSRTERYQAVAEDQIDGVVILNPDRPFGRQDLVIWLAWWSALTLMVSAVVGVYGWSTAASASGKAMWGVGVLTLGVGCLVAGFRLWRRYDQPTIAAAVLLGGVVNTTVGGALVVPLPQQPGVTWLGAPQIAGGAIALLLSVLVVRGGPVQRQTWAAFAGACSVIVGLAAIGISYGGQMWVWPAVAGVSMLLIRKAATLVRFMAGIALPPVPGPGEDVEMDELLDAVVDVGAEAHERDSDEQTNPKDVWQQILESVPKSSARLAERSVLSQQLLAGFMSAGAAAITVSVLHLLQRGHFLPHSLALCALVVVTMAFRSRLPADRRCRWALLTAAAATFTGMVLKLVLWWPGWAAAGTIAVVVVPLIVLMCVAAASGSQRLNAITKTWLQRFDRLCVAAVPMLLLWVAGGYDYLRNVTWFPGN
ncbi:type VII secretion integral membrane protein EccD [Mycobacteroides salmoniphilum]|nr:type VII secretion integral membrane protein EccD [Mycobacteroides salmoniphilum]